MLRTPLEVAHGVHQHSGLYAPFAARLAEAGFASLRLDFTGFGHRREENAPMVGDFDVPGGELFGPVLWNVPYFPRVTPEERGCDVMRCDLGWLLGNQV